MGSPARGGLLQLARVPLQMGGPAGDPFTAPSWAGVKGSPRRGGGGTHLQLRRGAAQKGPPGGGFQNRKPFVFRHFCSVAFPVGVNGSVSGLPGGAHLHRVRGLV